MVTGPLGVPMPVSGGYAYIYELRSDDGTRKALRCFREDDTARRSAPPRRAASWPTPGHSPGLARHFIRAEWEETCLRTPAGTVPAMVMDWAEGRTLGAFLEAAQDDGEALRDIRERLARMLGLLAGAGIAHGDLQTGNILVDPDGTPVLIDYDGMRLPGSPRDLPPRTRTALPAPRVGRLLRSLAQGPTSPPWPWTWVWPPWPRTPASSRAFSTGENVLFRAED